VRPDTALGSDGLALAPRGCPSPFLNRHLSLALPRREFARA
jgi:hypothetical protein